MKLYHGTDVFSAEKIISEGISTSVGRPFLDFGRGFMLHQSYLKLSNGHAERLLLAL